MQDGQAPKSGTQIHTNQLPAQAAQRIRDLRDQCSRQLWDRGFVRVEEFRTGKLSDREFHDRVSGAAELFGFNVLLSVQKEWADIGIDPTCYESMSDDLARELAQYCTDVYRRLCQRVNLPERDDIVQNIRGFLAEVRTNRFSNDNRITYPALHIAANGIGNDTEANRVSVSRGPATARGQSRRDLPLPAKERLSTAITEIDRRYSEYITTDLIWKNKSTKSIERKMFQAGVLFARDLIRAILLEWSVIPSTPEEFDSIRSNQVEYVFQHVESKFTVLLPERFREAIRKNLELFSLEFSDVNRLKFLASSSGHAGSTESWQAAALRKFAVSEAEPVREEPREAPQNCAKDSIVKERRALMVGYKLRMKTIGVKSTYRTIVKSANKNWNDPTPVKWWVADDPRCTPIMDTLIRKVLTS